MLLTKAKRFWRKFDWLLFGAILAIVVVGIVFIWSSGPFLPKSRGEAQKQIIWAMLGFTAFFVAIIPHYKRLENHSYLIYALVLGMLAYTLKFGAVRNYARRWIDVRVMLVQPSELMKIAYVLALARYLMYRKNYRTLGGLIWPLFMALVPMGLIILQPDLGTSLLFLPVFFSMLYAAGARARHLVVLAVAGGAVMLAAFFADDITGYLARKNILFSGPTGILRSYQKTRIVGFVTGETYQQKQSVIAIGSGRLLGKGLRRGTQNRYNLLPERQTDFIFGVIGEETGFLGCMGVLLLYFLIILLSFTIAAQTRDPFGRLIVVGLSTILAIQVLINVGMALHLMPITGLTLPLVSYGGTSLTTTLLSLALILNVKMHPEPTFARKVFEFDRD